jgi:hypothetical protein
MSLADCATGEKPPVNEIFKPERRQPFRVEANLGIVPFEYFENLFGVGFRILVDFIAGEWFTRDRASSGVADQRGEVSDHKDDLVTQILKVLELAHQHRVAQV